MGIARKAVKGTAWSFLANSSQQILQFCFFIFLARILDAGMFGIMALAMVCLDLLTTVARMGIVEVLIREEDDNRRNQQAWLGLLGVGALIMLALFALAHPIAAFYKVPELAAIIMFLAPLCLLQNLSVVHEARLRRNFAYDQLAIRITLSVLIGGVFGVAFALMGFGLWSLVMQKLVTVIIQSALLWAMDDWRPIYGLRHSWKSLARMFREGAQLMTGQFMQMLNNRAVDVLVGLFLGVVALGYLKIAWKIFDFMLQFSIQPIANVALSTFSRMQNDTARLQKSYLRMVQIAALFAFPVFFGTAAVADKVIPLLFGAQWQASVPLMQMMSLLALAALVNMFFVPLMTALGQSGIVFRQGIIQTTLSVALTALASQFSIVAVVVAHVVRAGLVAALNIWWQKTAAKFSVRKFLQVLWPPMYAALLMAIVVWICGEVLGSLGSVWLDVAVQVALGAVLYAGLMWMGFSRELRDLWHDVQDLLPKRVRSVIGRR